AEETRKRRRAFHQALRSGAAALCPSERRGGTNSQKCHGPVFTSSADPSRAVRASCAYLFLDEQDDRGKRGRHQPCRHPHPAHPAPSTTFRVRLRGERSSAASKCPAVEISIRRVRHRNPSARSPFALR